MKLPCRERIGELIELLFRLWCLEFLGFRVHDNEESNRKDNRKRTGHWTT